MSGYEVSARERAVCSLRAEVRRIARDVFGAVLTETPIAGMTVATRPGLDEPLVGVRAAVLARDVAAGQVRVYAEAARGAGRSWDEVGEALGTDADEYGAPRAELAFLLLVEGRPLPESARSFRSGRSATRWTCTACGQRITDTGPFEAAPFNNEDGHAGDCPRHAAEITAYRATWGDR